MPDNLRQMLTKQIERLPEEEQRLLEVASVVGAEFSAEAVAVGLNTDVEQVEEWCEGVALRGHFLRAGEIATLPNGSVVARYGFSHALYQSVLYERLGAARRMRLHRRIGEAEEAVYGERTGEIAAELAMHFERGQDLQRAIVYHEQAGRNASRRHAPREALEHFDKGLALLEDLPETPERNALELRLQAGLTVPLTLLKGNASPELEHVYARARSLCEEIEEAPELFPVLYGLTRLSAVRQDFASAQRLGSQLLEVAQTTHDQPLLLVASAALGAISLFMGNLVQARELFEQAIQIFDSEQHSHLVFEYGDDPGLVAHRLPLSYSMAVRVPRSRRTSWPASSHACTVASVPLRFCLGLFDAILCLSIPPQCRAYS